MSKLWIFRMVCLAIALVCLLVMGAELFLKRDFSLTVLYAAGGLAIAGLIGNAVGAVVQYQKTGDKKVAGDK